MVNICYNCNYLKQTSSLTCPLICVCSSFLLTCPVPPCGQVDSPPDHSVELCKAISIPVVCGR